MTLKNKMLEYIQQYLLLYTKYVSRNPSRNLVFNTQVKPCWSWLENICEYREDSYVFLSCLLPVLFQCPQFF